MCAIARRPNYRRLSTLERLLAPTPQREKEQSAWDIWSRTPPPPACPPEKMDTNNTLASTLQGTSFLRNGHRQKQKQGREGRWV